MGMPVFSNGTAVPGTVSALVYTGPGRLIGILVTSSSSLTLKAWDALTATGTVLFDTTAAITAPAYIKFPANFSTGLFLTIGGTGGWSAIIAKPHE